MHRIVRTEKGAAGQIIGAADTNWRSAAELVRARHCQQAATIVGDGEGGVTDFGEGTATEDPVNTERDGHAGDLLNAQRLRETLRRRLPMSCARLSE